MSSTLLRDEDAALDEARASRHRNAWLRGNASDARLEEVLPGIDALRQRVATLRLLLDQAERSEVFRTDTQLHDGPPAYRASLEAAEIAGETAAATREMEATRVALRDAAGVFAGLADGVRPDSWPRPWRAAARRSLDLAVETYQRAFPRSHIDIDRRVEGLGVLRVASQGGAATAALAGLVHLLS